MGRAAAWRRLLAQVPGAVPMRWRRVGAYVAVVAAFSVSNWRAESASHDAKDAAVEAQETAEALRVFILASQEAACEGANKSRDELRRAVSSVLVDGLVAAATTPPDPARVEALKQNLVDLFEAEFGAKAWDPASRSCVDVPIPP